MCYVCQLVNFKEAENLGLSIGDHRSPTMESGKISSWKVRTTRFSHVTGCIDIGSKACLAMRLLLRIENKHSPPIRERQAEK